MPSTTIALPIAMASGLVLGGLTAPALRAALVMIGSASASGRIDMLKPDLERMAGLRLDNADRFMNRVRECRVEIDGDVTRAFDEIVYTPGVKGRLAGVVTAQLSPAFLAAISTPSDAGRTTTIAIDELRRLTTVPGILMLVWLSTHRDADRLRLDEETALQVFGPYIGRAAITRTTRRDGEHAWTSLSRIFTELVVHGVRDLWDALPDVDIDAAPISRTGRGHGRAWSYIEVTMAPKVRLPSVRELAAKQRQQEEYERHRFDNADPSKMRSNGSVKPQDDGASVPSNEGAS